MADISYQELALRAGISEPYACQLLNGKRTGPSLKLALQIYDRTGLQFGILEGLSAETIEELRPKAQAA
jgi:transcriptional regulator with XRE-family HTH domain